MEDGLMGAGAPEGRGCGIAYTVQRKRLLQDLMTRGRDAGIAVLYAPCGFGKTSLLLQCVEAVRADPERGYACFIEGEGAEVEELLVQLDAIVEEARGTTAPLIAIDDLPLFDADATQLFIECLRSLRGREFAIIIACLPSNKVLVNALGDSIKLNAQALRVQAKEYSDWVRTLSLSSTLDVYGLTQGVPRLVAALHALPAAPDDGKRLLESAIVDVVGAVIEDLVHAGSPLLQALCLMYLMGEGNTDDLRRAGIEVSAEEGARIRRELGVVELDPATGMFRCLGTETGARREIREVIVALFPELLFRALRIHMYAGRVDAAVALASCFLSDEAAYELLIHFPMKLVLAGHAAYVRRIVDAQGPLHERGKLELTAVLADYAAALLLGDYREMKVAYGILNARGDEIEREIAPEDWACARALAALWEGVSGARLSDIDCAVDATCESARMLESYRRVQESLLEGAGSSTLLQTDMQGCSTSNVLDIPWVLLLSLRLMEEASRSRFSACDERDVLLVQVADELKARKLKPLYLRFEATIALRKLFAGGFVDESGVFAEASNEALRCGDTGLQLFYMTLEGWQALLAGQTTNAAFRANQVRKLAPEGATLPRQWAALIASTAHIRECSRIRACEEAEALDLGAADVSPVEAWSGALLLSAARYDAELGAWFSLHKAQLFDDGIRLPARLALKAMGAKADPLRRLIPQERYTAYVLSAEEEIAACGVRLLERPVVLEPDTGHISFRLFGGFKVERNGHTLCDLAWKRKRCSVLAARLALAGDTFVGRKTITEEMWPRLSYARARENLYVTLSSLRRALGQHSDGPQYVVTQGDCLGFNADYADSDVGLFNELAREVLLARTDVPSAKVIEFALRAEQLYVGPIIVPEAGDLTYFTQVRDATQSRFFDCMIKGANLAIEEEDLPTARWLVEAALRQGSTREDVVRCALRVFELGGRRREAVDLYSAHFAHLEREVNKLPELETRMAYSEVVKDMKQRGLL